MKGDFSRSTFLKEKHYSGVRMQQGRVQLDADWNEQLDIATHLRETAIGDLVGAHGAPEDGGGFAVSLMAGRLTLSAGRYYVDGILIENEGDVALEDQPYLPDFAWPTAPSWYALYLDVFRRQLTGLEDPEVLEPALGGPDTATRQQTVWQAHLQKVSGSDPSCADFAPPRAAAAPRLSARSSSLPKENQLYRVEVHDGSFDAAGDAQPPTFKWSRDNGSVAARIEDPAGNEIHISAQISQDLAGGFAASQWIEVTDDRRLLRGKPGFFAQLSTVAGQILTVQPWVDGTPDLAGEAILRRWESEVLEVARPSTDNGWLDLEDGVQIRFEDPNAEYHTGDYWLIAGRSAAGVLWPVDPTGEPVAREPHGVRHHYAPLAMVELDANGWQPLSTETTKRCRQVFRPSTTGDLGEPKVRVAGDTMTGKLTIDADLQVKGVATIGPTTPGGVKGKLVMDAAPIELAGGESAERGILFAKVITPEQPSDEAFLRRFATGATSRKLVLGVGNSSSDALSLRQRGRDLLTLAGEGLVGIGTSEPRAGLHVKVNKILLDGPLFLPGKKEPAKDQVLTAIDGEGQAEWRDLPKRDAGVPIFLGNKILVRTGSGKTDGWITYEIDPAKVPADASAVLLEAEGAMLGPDAGLLDARLWIRKGADEIELLLLRGRAAAAGDDVAWANQGVYPLKKGAKASFQYLVTDPGFGIDYSLRIVGYYP